MTEISATPDSGPERFIRASGLGGLGFLAIVVAENLLRQPQPLADASLEQIIAYYQQRPGMIALSQSLFVLSVPCLLLFAAGTWRRLRSASASAEGWGWVGAVAASLMVATFGATVALDVVLAATADTLADKPFGGQALWKLKMALFTVNVAVLSTTMLGFGLGCRAGGVGPRWLASLAAAGGLVGLAGAFPMRQVVAGSPWGLLGLACFLCWLLFLAVTSASHLRSRNIRRERSP